MAYNAITMGIYGASSGISSTNYYGDPYWNNVVLMLHGDGNITDSSIKNSTFTANGTATTTTSISKFGTGCMSFSAQNDYFSNTGTWDVAASDFTVEAWVYPTFRAPSNTTMSLFHFKTSTNNGLHIHINSSGYLVTDDGRTATTPGTIVVPLNTWTHIAVSRYASTCYGYVNGVQCFANSTTPLNFYASTSTTLQIGKYYTYYSGTGSVYSYIGYIDELKVTKGIARYNTGFTVPTAPYINQYKLLDTYPVIDTNFKNVVGLFHGETLTDSSVQPLTITNSGVVVSASNVAYGAKSMYFNGATYATSNSTSVLDISGGTFTIEGWVNPTNYSNNPYVVELRTTTTSRTLVQIDSSGYVWFYVVVSGTAYYVKSTSTITAGSYIHFAAVLSSNTMYLFLNGILHGTTTAGALPSGAYQLYLGRYIDNGSQGWLTGYVDDLRITKGVARYTANFNPPGTAYYDPNYGDPYWYNVSCLMNGDTLTDSSQYAQSITNTGVTVSTSTYKFGSGSMYFNGSSYLQTAASSMHNISTGNFTAECFVYTTNLSTAPYVMHFYGDNNNRLAIQVGTVNSQGVVSVWAVVGGTATNIITTGSSTTMVDGAFYHIALCRSSSTWMIFINGVLSYSGSFVSLTSMNYLLELGKCVAFSSNPLNGYIDDLRITKGIARYTANFAVPSNALPAIPGYISSIVTRGLILDVNNQFDSSSTVYDTSSYKRIGSNSGVTFATTSTNQNSMVTSTTGLISFPDSSDFKINTFSISFWIKTTTTSNLVVFEKDSNNGFSVQISSSSISPAGSVAGRLMMNAGGGNSTLYGTPLVNDGNWHHAVIVYNTLSSQTMYIDNVSCGNSSTVGLPIYSTAPLYIGSRAGTYGFPGNLAKVRMYNVALTAAEVQTLYNDVP